MDLREFIGNNFIKRVKEDPEFAVCWDLSIVDSSLLIEDKAKIAYYLQFSRAAIHFISYINKLNLLKEGTPSNFLDIVSSLFDTLICMAKISGLSPKEVPLKGFFELVVGDTNSNPAFSQFRTAIDKLSLHEVTIFMWHDIIVGEISTPWFSFNSEKKCDWQGIRNNLLILFSLLTYLCYKLDISFETLCSHYVKSCKKIKDENND